MNAPLFKMRKQKLWIKAGIKILMCLLIALMYLDGEHYPQCMCIFPDEILDLPCSISPQFIEDEIDILFEKKANQRFIDSEEIQLFSIWSFFSTKNNSLIESLLLQGFKKRLFLLQHYNS
jgi:hypothetical protein